MAQNPSILNHTGERGTSALTLASKNGHASVVQTLLAQPDIQINHAEESGVTALLLASEFGHKEVVVKLLQHPWVDIDAVDALGNTALWATYNVDLTKDGQWSALGAACRYGHPDVVEVLLSKQDIDVNVKFGCRETPLMHCSNAAVTQLLLKHPNIHDNNLQDYHTALTSAAWNGRADVVDVLLRQPTIQVNLTNEANETALYVAIQQGHTDSVRLLLAKDGIDVNQTTRGLTYLILAVELGRQEIVSLLLDVPSIELNALDDYGFTALGRAIQKENYGIVNLLLARHPDNVAVDAMDELRLESLAKYLTVDAAVALLLQDMPVQAIHGNVFARDSHSFSWTKFLDSSVAVTSTVRTETIQRILSHNPYESVGNTPELVRQLAYTKDQQGREALHTTDATTREFLKGLMHFCGRYEIYDGPPIHVSPTAVVVHAYDHGLCQQVFAEHATQDSQSMACLDVTGFVKCNQTLGRVFTERSVNQHKFQRDAESWQNEFLLWDKDGNGIMSEGEYLQYCRHYFGGKIKIAMKFMRNADDHEREMTSRRGLDADFVLHTLPSLDQQTFRSHVKSLRIHEDLEMTAYPHVVVMPAADRSLEDIHLKERPSDAKVRSMLYDVVVALQHLHGKSLVHGDLKKLNVLRVHNGLKLIDLDAAARMDERIGTKFSSGILPPEMFYKLKSEAEVQQYKSYWEKSAVTPSRWNKLKPKGNYVVKAFDHGGSSTDDLPHDLVQATPATDLWALGCLMYQMICGAELVATDLNQDVVSNRLAEAASWTTEKLNRRIQNNIADELAMDLVSKLLVVNPTERLSLDQVVSHAYFTGVVDLEPMVRMLENVAQAQPLALQQKTNEDIQAHLYRAKDDVMCGLIDAHDVLVPTSFVVLPFIVEDPSHILGRENTAMDFFKRLMTSGKALKDAMATSKPLGDALAGLTSDKALYLYLIDKVTGDMVTNDPNGVYPIEIPTANEAFLTTAMPWIQGGLSFLKSVKGMSGMMKSFGVPSVPDMAGLKSISEALGEPTCTFGVLRDAVPDVPVESIRGAALRELTHVFEKWDEDRTFGGLERAILENGRVVWTNHEAAKDIRERKRMKQTREVSFETPRSSTLRQLYC
ncbi:Aste57867_9339 [Aphanomyces stellatus]|uniref:Aste57867_9339 protein n=1 Tax=Aphanomyces stellatus TaxID=120398 RepID=A0A485KML9_9STRA|nr:hypothetical protein As57867_009303 [Aphanomyces stellatus]VFT86220.1 Aste57867_9339 [Aphanomyces stellatus]